MVCADRELLLRRADLCDSCALLKSSAQVKLSTGNPARFALRFRWLIPCCAIGFLILTSAIRIHRVEIVSGVAAGPAVDAHAPRLLIPGHANQYWVAD